MGIVITVLCIGFFGAVVAWDGCRVLIEERWIRAWRIRHPSGKEFSEK